MWIKRHWETRSKQPLKGKNPKIVRLGQLILICYNDLTPMKGFSVVLSFSQRYGTQNIPYNNIRIDWGKIVFPVSIYSKLESAESE